MYDDLIKRLRRCQQFQCRECEYEKVNGCRAKLNEEAADAIEKLLQIETDLRDCRNELCIKCGQYQTKHLGSCNGCRWEKS